MRRKPSRIIPFILAIVALLPALPIAWGWWEYTPERLHDMIEGRAMRSIFDSEGRFIGASGGSAARSGQGDELQDPGYVPAPAVLPSTFVAGLRVLEDRGHDDRGLHGICGFGFGSAFWRVLTSGARAGGSGFMAQNAKQLVAADAPDSGAMRLMMKLHQIGVTCRLHDLLAAGGDEAAARQALHLYASTVPMLQGNGTTRGITAASWILFGRAPEALTDAQQLVLAAAPKLPLMPLQPGDEKIDCLLVHPGDGNRSYDSKVAKLHRARAVMCRVVLRALHAAPEVLQGERLQRARQDLLQMLRDGFRLDDPWGGNTDQALLINPVRRLRAMLPQALQDEVRREASRVGKSEAVKLTMAVAPQKGAVDSAFGLRVSMNLANGQVIGLAAGQGVDLDWAHAVGPLGPALIVLAATLREEPGVSAGDGLIVDRQGVLRTRCGCESLKAMAAVAVQRQDVHALRAVSVALGPERLVRAASLVGIGLAARDAGLADRLADGSLKVPARQWLFAAQAIHAAGQGPAVRQMSRGPRVVVDSFEVDQIARPWLAELTVADRAGLRSAMGSGIAPAVRGAWVVDERLGVRRAQVRSAQPAVQLLVLGDTITVTWQRQVPAIKASWEPAA